MTPQAKFVPAEPGTTAVIFFLAGKRDDGSPNIVKTRQPIIGWCVDVEAERDVAEARVEAVLPAPYYRFAWAFMLVEPGAEDYSPLLPIRTAHTDAYGELSGHLIEESEAARIFRHAASNFLRKSDQVASERAQGGSA